MATETLGGGTDGITPTWQYVQQVIASNINKADDQVRLAEAAINSLAGSYVPANWFVDIDVGTDVNLLAASPVPFNQAYPPQEPVYDAFVPDSLTIPQINVPSGISVQAIPPWDLTLEEVPPEPELLPYSDLPTLDPLPLIDVLVPTFDVDVLTTEFSFTEAPYTERVSQEVKTEILRVLGGDLGIPQAYWDALWAKVSGDLGEQQVGLLRNARNRGAATFWGLPTEAVLTASRAVQDEANKKLQVVRIEQAQKQAELAHDDFWKAMERAIAYEQQWIEFHNQIQTRALAAAQYLVSFAIQVHNANVARFNLILQSAKLSMEILDLKVSTILKKYEALLRKNQAEIEQNKGVIDVYTANIQAYSVSQNTQIQAIAEKTKWWNSQWESHTRYEALKQEKAKTDVSNYLALLSRIDALSKGAATLLNARTETQGLTLKHQLGVLEQEKGYNAARLDVARITQAAQEIQAKLDIAQAQFISGQGSTIMQSAAELAVGLAQALITVSDVNLGSSYSAGDSWSVTASRNAEKVW